jgi:hypothetical protein
MPTFANINSTTPLLFLGLLLLLNCVEPFTPNITGSNNLLVVEGSISNENKQHQVTLTRTSKLNDLTVIPEKGATVQLQIGNGITLPLTESKPGVYLTPTFSGVVGTTYKLLISTSDKKTYASKEVTLKETPPIGQVYAKYPAYNAAGVKGIQIYLDAEDVSNKTQFYRWEYEETYEIKTPFPSKFVWLGGNNITYRLQAVDNCWASDTSSNVNIKSTKGFLNARVTAQPIKFIPATSPEMVLKYSILIKQYALSEDAYLFWQQLQSVNETQGSLYDIQPGEVPGNLFPVNHEEAVLGYFDAATVSKKRSFFTPKDFEEVGFRPPAFLRSCFETDPILVPIEKLGEVMEIYQTSLTIYDAMGEGPAYVLLLRIPCCNCTSQGTTIKPDYWE